MGADLEDGRWGPNQGVWDGSPQWGPGAKPWHGVWGQNHPEAGAFLKIHNVNFKAL